MSPTYWSYRSRRIHESDERTVVVFHATPGEIDALVGSGYPFFPGWGGGLVTMALRDDGTTDWEEVRELLTESYCILAPKKLVARLGALRPDAPERSEDD